MKHIWAARPSIAWINRVFATDWLLIAALTVLMFGWVHMEGRRSGSLGDIATVRCAGQMLDSGGNPYSELGSICRPGTLDFFYPPLIARVAAVTVRWLGVPLWMAVYEFVYALSIAALIFTCIRLLSAKHGFAGAVVRMIGILLAMCGGIAVTALRSGNVIVIFWAGLATVLFMYRNTRLATLVIVAGACIKFFLIYLLVIPALVRKDVRGPVLAGCSVVVIYLLQWYFDPKLFASFTSGLRVLSHTSGYAGSSSLQLGDWVAAVTHIPTMRTVTVVLIAGALLWRGRTLFEAYLKDARADGWWQLRMLCMLVLTVTALSPRVASYDLLILLPALAVLVELPSQRLGVIIVCMTIPWVFRLALVAAHMPHIGSWFEANLGLDYDALWGIYLFLTWCAITGYAWFALGPRPFRAALQRDSPPNVETPSTLRA